MNSVFPGSLHLLLPVTYPEPEPPPCCGLHSHTQVQYVPVFPPVSWVQSHCVDCVCWCRTGLTVVTVWRPPHPHTGDCPHTWEQDRRNSSAQFLWDCSQTCGWFPEDSD